MGITNIRVGGHKSTHGNTSPFPEISTSNTQEWEVVIWSDLHLGNPEQMSLQVPSEASLIMVEKFFFFVLFTLTVPHTSAELSLAPP